MLCDAGNPPPDSDGHDVITTLSEEVALAQAAEFCSQGNLDKIQTIQIVGTMLMLATVGDHWWSFTTAWQGGRRKGCASVEGSGHSQADRPC